MRTIVTAATTLTSQSCVRPTLPAPERVRAFVLPYQAVVIGGPRGGCGPLRRAFSRRAHRLRCVRPAARHLCGEVCCAAMEPAPRGDALVWLLLLCATWVRPGAAILRCDVYCACARGYMCHVPVRCNLSEALAIALIRSASRDAAAPPCRSLLSCAQPLLTRLPLEGIVPSFLRSPRFSSSMQTLGNAAPSLTQRLGQRMSSMTNPCFKSINNYNSTMICAPKIWIGALRFTNFLCSLTARTILCAMLLKHLARMISRARSGHRQIRHLRHLSLPVDAHQRSWLASQGGLPTRQ